MFSNRDDWSDKLDDISSKIFEISCALREDQDNAKKDEILKALEKQISELKNIMNTVTDRA